jgi:superfamily II DNA/RNA helicase
MDTREFIGHLFLARDVAHSVHLATDSYSQHVALNAFYDGIIDLADKFAEAYQGRHGLIGAIALHGELAQMVRREALAEFKAQRTRVLVATDLAARGIDIAQLPAVVNYDLPRSAVDYVHRIGRTGRAGEEGVAVSFVSAATEAHFRLIEKRHELAGPREVIAGFEPTETEVPAAATGGIKGKRKSKKDKLREAAGQTRTVESAAPASGFVWPAWRGAAKDQT